MLIRRFSIVCLIAALFGMGLAILVAEAGRSSDRWQGGRPFACMTDENAFCGQTVRR
ncbi:hypothetical protein R2G56_09445 [Nitratireductor aquimarinus]|uniref:Transmembrane protein n=1 Tax=Nitratireductor aquimarinus TaxID=889300 RepID=A0ABU4AJT9_9HYPH|nr:MULTISPECIES: hypothetical protein [Nitratireductor]MDV6226509.1 hypothetical protein [Nitratireductor aquimarinus]